MEEKRGKQKNFEYLTGGRVMLSYELPLNEIVLDFYDKLKSVSRGYASLDYHFAGYWESDMVKLDILVAGDVGGRALDHRASRFRLRTRAGAGVEDAAS